MHLNVKKTKELQISFLNDSPRLEQLTVNNDQVEVVSSFKLLGLIITSNLSWDQHVTYICSKARKRLYDIRLLKRTRVSISDLTRIFCSVVRPILEYGCQVWHFSLTEKLSTQIEQIQRRATKIILSENLPYDLRLKKLNLMPLAERRTELCRKLFQPVTRNKDDKLNSLLPRHNEHAYLLRNPREFPIFKAKTERFHNSYICKSVRLFDIVILSFHFIL